MNNFVLSGMFRNNVTGITEDRCRSEVVCVFIIAVAMDEFDDLITAQF